MAMFIIHLNWKSNNKILYYRELKVQIIHSSVISRPHERYSPIIPNQSFFQISSKNYSYLFRISSIMLLHITLYRHMQFMIFCSSLSNFKISTMKSHFLLLVTCIHDFLIARIISLNGYKYEQNCNQWIHNTLNPYDTSVNY